MLAEVRSNQSLDEREDALSRSAEHFRPVGMQCIVAILERTLHQSTLCIAKASCVLQFYEYVRQVWPIKDAQALTSHTAD